MNENVIPKWQRELRSFLGIKSGIILEGNVFYSQCYSKLPHEEIRIAESLVGLL